MLANFLSLPVSVILLLWILRMKKDDPFPRYTFIRLIIAGIVAGILSAIVSILGGVVNFILSYGPESLIALIRDKDPSLIMQIINGSETTLTAGKAIAAFIRTFITVGFVEEIFKFLCTRPVMKREGVVKTRMDALLCLAIAAISFQLTEDWGYASGNTITAIMRALTPFHFTFAVIMGYYYGLARTTHRKIYYFLAIFVPAFIHTIFDYSINMIQYEEGFIVLALFSIVLLIGVTVIMIIRIRRWHKDGTLNVPIDGSQRKEDVLYEQ